LSGHPDSGKAESGKAQSEGCYFEKQLFVIHWGSSWWLEQLSRQHANPGRSHGLLDFFSFSIPVMNRFSRGGTSRALPPDSAYIIISFYLCRLPLVIPEKKLT
jgi:hypothetical protein